MLGGGVWASGSHGTQLHSLGTAPPPSYSLSGQGAVPADVAACVRDNDLYEEVRPAAGAVEIPGL
jgi:hypothetical protein